GSPLSMACQLAPPFVVLKGPPTGCPAYAVSAFVGSTASATTPGGEPLLKGKPVLATRQCPPPSIVLKTPPLSVPAYTVPGLVGASASAVMMPPSGPWLVQMPDDAGHVVTPGWKPSGGHVAPAPVQYSARSQG